MSWFKEKKELELFEEEYFIFDPTNPYNHQVIDEEEFIEVKIGENKNDNKFLANTELPTESEHKHS